MLNILLSHWTIYVYVSYVVVLIVLCLVYRPRENTVYYKLRQFRKQTSRTPSGLHSWLLAPGPNPRHFH